MTESMDGNALTAHRGFLERLAADLLRDAGSVEDVVQDTFVAALEARPATRDPRRLRAWLGQVATRTARLRWRRDAARAARERDVARTRSESGGHEALERFELSSSVVRAVDALDPAEREVIVLRYFEDLPPR